MKTMKLYKNNAYLSTCEAKVLEIVENKVRLDQTCFFPEGGGQSSDIGVIENIQVIHVFEKGDYVWHQLASTDKLNVGDTVLCSIDWTHRFDNMQRHAGEHIMSGVWYELYKATNTGFHMGDDYMTIDLTLDENSPYKEITQDMLDEVELKVNEIIWSNLPIVSNHFEKREDTLNLNLRKPVKIEEDITIVTVGSTENPSDSVACCGTHPAFSGEIGILKIFKVEKNKSMFRIYFDAGKRAYSNYKDISEKINIIGSMFSAGKDDIITKVQSHRDRHDDLLNQMKELKQTILEIKSKDALKDINQLKKVNTLLLNDFDTDDMFRFGNHILNNINGYLFIYSDQDLVSVLMSNKGSEFNCKDLVNSLRSQIIFKGGGGDNSAQLRFESKDQLDLLIEKLNHL